ncbi:unnamed protein product [Cuscuta campestris]|uniref:Uncharacterized protein n=1 Tax=Cuscuta campestris TaxID=132261 RepID=A0A484K3T3_9ASTE|nr:unnamed protein product [Cuscuta campestris]
MKFPQGSLKLLEIMDCFVHTGVIPFILPSRFDNLFKAWIKAPHITVFEGLLYQLNNELGDIYILSAYCLQQVSHGAIQFTAYEELRKLLIDFKSRKTNKRSNDELLNSLDYSFLGGSSKVAAILSTYPFQVIRSRLQQRPSIDGIHRYTDSLHAVKETARFEGIRGFYKGITANLLKNVPASAVTFVVYEDVLKLFKLVRSKD